MTSICCSFLGMALELRWWLRWPLYDDATPVLASTSGHVMSRTNSSLKLCKSSDQVEAMDV